MRRHDLGLLSSLDVILEEVSVTRAAERLRVTQPALSAQLARLRKIFGDPLLVPVDRGRGLRLTPRGMELRAPLHDLLAQLARLVDQPQDFDPRTARRDFHIAVNDNAASMVGLDLIERIRAKASPGIRLTLRQVDPRSLPEQAAKGGVDLIIGSEASMPTGIRSQPLLKDRFEVAQRKRHPRGGGPVTMKQYCALEHVIVSSSGGFRSAIDDLLESRELGRRVVVSVQYYAMVPSILQRTDCIATLPSRFLAKFRRQLDTFRLPFKLNDFHLSMGWHPRSDGDAAHRWLRLELSKIAATVAR